MNIPKRVTKKTGPKPKYDFASLTPGVSNGIEYKCKSSSRDAIWASLRTLCSKHTKENKIGAVYKCYPTETGVYFYREA